MDPSQTQRYVYRIGKERCIKKVGYGGNGEGEWRKRKTLENGDEESMLV